jgi:hypothetical protein
MIPGWSLSLFDIYANQHTLNTHISYYADMKFELKTLDVFYVSGGMTAYEWEIKDKAAFYPFRMDYELGMGIKYKKFEMGIAHGCFHPIAPNVAIFELGKIDAAVNRVFFKIGVSEYLFK